MKIKAKRGGARGSSSESPMELWEKILFVFSFLFCSPVALVWGIVWAIAGRTDEHRYWGRLGMVALGTYIFMQVVYLGKLVPDTEVWPIGVALVGVLALVIMMVRHRLERSRGDTTK